jgi:hypothetical protein
MVYACAVFWLWYCVCVCARARARCVLCKVYKSATHNVPYSIHTLIIWILSYYYECNCIVTCIGARNEEVYNGCLVKAPTGQPIFFVAECKSLYS